MDFLRRRILTSVVVFVVVVNLAFFIPHLAPGNAAEVLAGGKFASTQTALIEQRLGIGKPLLTQYVLYLRNIFTNWPTYFGVSYAYSSESVGPFFWSFPRSSYQS